MSEAKQLTVEIFRSLTYRLSMHLNGGSKFSVVSRVNDEWGLVYSHRTNGRPEYRYTDRTISTTDGEIVFDLMAPGFEENRVRFIDAYNARLALQLRVLPESVEGDRLNQESES